MAKLVELVNVIPSVAVALEIAENKVVVTEVYFPGITENPAAVQIVAPVIPSMFAILLNCGSVEAAELVVGDPLNLTVSP